MKKWISDYETYVNGEKNDRHNELKLKIETKTANKEEYSEYRKYEKIQNNLPKLKNLIEYYNEITDLKEQIEDELLKRQRISKINEENNNIKEKIHSQIENLDEKISEILIKLEDTNLSPDERQNLINERDINNLKYTELTNKLKIIPDEQKLPKTDITNHNKLNSYSEENLEKLHKKVCIRLSKCNFYGKQLINGKNIDDIGKDYENNVDESKYNHNINLKNAEDRLKTKLIAKRENAKKLEELKEASRDQEQLPLKEEEIKDNGFIEKEELAEKTEKKGVFEKIKDKVKGFFNRFKQKALPKGKNIKAGTNNAINPEDENNHDKFVKYLSDLDNYDLDTVLKGKEALEDARKSRLDEIRKKSDDNEPNL